MQVTIKTNFPHLTEAGQGPVCLKFAFMDPNKKENITPFFKCKDYANDLFWSENNNKEGEVYGFSWKPGKLESLTKNGNHYILIRKDSAKKTEELTDQEKINILKLVNSFAKKLKFKPSKLYTCNDGHICISYDAKWSERPYTNSALFLLLRLGVNYDGKTDPIQYYSDGQPKKFISPHDCGYFMSSKKTIIDLFNGKIDKTDSYTNFKDMGYAHDSSGLVGYSAKH